MRRYFHTSLVTSCFASGKLKHTRAPDQTPQLTTRNATFKSRALIPTDAAETLRQQECAACTSGVSPETQTAEGATEAAESKDQDPFSSGAHGADRRCTWSRWEEGHEGVPTAHASGGVNAERRRYYYCRSHYKSMMEMTAAENNNQHRDI